MAVILQFSKFCQIHDEDDHDFLKLIDSHLSFRVQGAEHTWAFKNHRWNGIKHILTSSLKFPNGLLPRVKELYETHNKDLTIQDKRPAVLSSTPIDIACSLTRLKKNPYQYQRDVVEIVKNHNMGIIRSATGSGKTIMSALMVAELGKTAIVYVIGKDLLWQTYMFFEKVFDQEIGIVGDGECKIRNINIVSVWSVGSALDIDNILIDSVDKEKPTPQDKHIKIRDLIKSAKVHIFDECHLASCDSIQEISANINAEHLYGMSASPYRDDGSDLLIEGVFGPKIVDISASYLIKSNYLVRPFIRFLEVPKLKEKVSNQYQSVYKKYIIDNPIRNGMIVDGAESLINQGFQTLVLFSRINHGKKLFKEISARVPALLLTGKDSSDTRNKAKELLESGEIKCIVASTIFDIGVDLPSLSGLIIAGGGKSSVRACQRIGRVIRKHESKKIAAIIDFADQAKYLLNHSKARYRVYSNEPEFSVDAPKIITG